MFVVFLLGCTWASLDSWNQTVGCMMESGFLLKNDR